MNYGSLCTGYDGIGMGLALAGVQLDPQFHAELDPGPSAVLKHEQPGVPNVGDIKAAPWELAPHVDLVSSGDPCQSISIAGRQQGRKDSRFLWPWVREAYRELRPGAIFLENVANIVSHDGGRTLAERFAHLRADGFEVRWTVLGACAVGAPHHRHRWYAVAGYVGAGAPEARRVGGPRALCGAPRSGGRFLLPTPQARDLKGLSARGPRIDGRMRSADDGTLPNAIALLPTPNARDGGSRGTPSPSHAARRAADPLRSLNLEDAAVLLPTPLAGDADKGQNSIGSTGGLSLAAAAGVKTWGKYAEAVALWESITGIPAPAPTELAPRGGRRLSPALPEWMMGLRPGLLTERLGRSGALKAAGNGVVPQAAAAAWRLLTT